jgi:hypothetical protein
MVGTDVAGGLSIYFHPEALPAFSEIAPEISIDLVHPGKSLSVDLRAMT